ncbi:uncharacterized protein MONBRDRAFT_8089 [Monosiga brevicollis MX1]|uniref:Ubiquitin-like domain-containing protein n=1 Tax=Monosiga brevicollis TaxID=81824 RepID=A9UZ08_MONBE|nr:uncharacterized protein MONBRDRAFT_8089 [Monosiga brevicollis MX1]EDQ89551.1 predicted protein [Monosiga brevicollis MX1]|eukprot:XP_001745580.1 hypothetical protein [Monosiga brevicollis MX1]
MSGRSAAQAEATAQAEPAGAPTTMGQGISPVAGQGQCSRTSTASMLQLTIKTVMGTSFSLHVDADGQVAHVKAIIAMIQDMPMSSQRLVYAGRELRDSDTLASLGIGNGAELVLAVHVQTSLQSPMLYDELLECEELIELALEDGRFRVLLCRDADRLSLIRFQVAAVDEDVGENNWDQRPRSSRHAPVQSFRERMQRIEDNARHRLRMADLQSRMRESKSRRRARRQHARRVRAQTKTIAPEANAVSGPNDQTAGMAGSPAMPVALRPRPPPPRTSKTNPSPTHTPNTMVVHASTPEPVSTAASAASAMLGSCGDEEAVPPALARRTPDVLSLEHSAAGYGPGSQTSASSTGVKHSPRSHPVALPVGTHAPRVERRHIPSYAGVHTAVESASDPVPAPEGDGVIHPPPRSRRAQPRTAGRVGPMGGLDAVSEEDDATCTQELVEAFQRMLPSRPEPPVRSPCQSVSFAPLRHSRSADTPAGMSEWSCDGLGTPAHLPDPLGTPLDGLDPSASFHRHASLIGADPLGQSGTDIPETNTRFVFSSSTSTPPEGPVHPSTRFAPVHAPGNHEGHGHSCDHGSMVSTALAPTPLLPALVTSAAPRGTLASRARSRHFAQPKPRIASAAPQGRQLLQHQVPKLESQRLPKI